MRNIHESIEDLEKKLAMCKFVKECLPDAKLHTNQFVTFGFSSKTVNKNYTKFDFVKTPNALYVVPYIELDFEYNGELEKVRVNSSPRSNRLAYVSWSSDYRSRVIKFSNIRLNLKTNKFKEDMLNACRLQIVNFIQNNREYKLDQKNLDPRLKKLLLFT